MRRGDLLRMAELKFGRKIPAYLFSYWRISAHCPPLPRGQHNSYDSQHALAFLHYLEHHAVRLKHYPSIDA